MSISLFFLGGVLFILSQGSPATILLQMGLITSVIVTSTSYGLGVGSIPYTMVGEVFIPEHKTLGSCIVQIVRCFTIFSLIKLVPLAIHSLGISSLFLSM